MANIVIIGAGISGLSTAYWLKEQGHRVTVLEKSGRAGGVIQSIREDDYLFEMGPNSFLDNGVETLELCTSLKLENEMLRQSMRANKRYIYFQDKLHEVPAGPGIFKSPLLSRQSHSKLLSEVLRGGNRTKQDESLASFVRRRLGEDVLNNLVTPFVSGVYAGDPEKLSLRATFPLLYDLEREHGGLVRGMVARLFKKKDPQAKKKPRAKNLCSFVEGMEVLIQALQESLGEGLRLNVDVIGVQKTEQGFRITIANEPEIVCDALVLAVPSYTAAVMLRDLLPQSSPYMGTIPYNRLCVLGMGFGREQIQHDCDGFGFLVPRNQGVRILGSIWSSSLFVRRAARGERCFTVFTGGGLDPSAYEMSDEQLCQQALIDLGKAVGLQGEPRRLHVFRWERAIPQYPVGHLDEMDKLHEERKGVPGLFLTGNYLDGVSVNDCIRNTRETSNDVHNYAANLSNLKVSL